MKYFAPKKRSFSRPPSFESLGLRFKNIKPQEALTEISQSIFSDRLILTFFIAWIFPLIFSSVYILIFFKSLPIEIPLYYSRTWGELQIASRQSIAIPIIGSLIVGFGSFAIVGSMIKQNKVLSYILAGSASLISVLATITVVNIVNLVK